ncbi:MAG: PilT/PilU family type 4a pilus ATPase [Candidatus Omnitrophota bacterium]
MLSFTLDERRNSQRIFIRIPGTMEITDPVSNSTKIKNVIFRNISAEGIGFETDELLPLNSQATVIFQLPKSGHQLRVSVKVARLESLDEERLFSVGTRFTGILEKDKQEIKDYVERLDINKLLQLTIAKKASDLHLVTFQPPVLRIYGELQILSDLPKLDPEDIHVLVYSIMTKPQRRIFEQYKELDFGIQYDADNRFRINVHQQKGYIEVACRVISSQILTIEELGLPEVVKDLARLRDGLILVAGPTGSGKSTTMAAMVGLINKEKKDVVITLERPIEFVYLNIKSIIKQREIGIDTLSFSSALKSTLRQDPNVIIVGELDDVETVKTALIAAEAGHLVIASFHAPNTLQAIDRLVNMFPPEIRKQALFQLSNSMKAILSQLLIPRKDKQGRVLAMEVLVNTDAVKRIIRNDELIQIPNSIQMGGGFKMQSMHESIRRLVLKGIVDEEMGNFYSSEFTRYSR